MDTETIRTPVPRPQFTQPPTASNPNAAQPLRQNQPNVNVNPNSGGPRPLNSGQQPGQPNQQGYPPGGQPPQNLIRQPPPLRRIDSRVGLPPQQIRPLGAPVGQPGPQQQTQQPQQFSSQQGPRPPGPQQYPQGPRPNINPNINPNQNQFIPNPAQNGTRPNLQPLSRPPFQPQVPQQLQNRPQFPGPRPPQPLINPNQPPAGGLPTNQQFRPQVNPQLRPGAPIRPNFPQQQQQNPTLRSQNSTDRIRASIPGLESPDRRMASEISTELSRNGSPMITKEDDDDDVVIGLTATPSKMAAPPLKPFESFERTTPSPKPHIGEVQRSDSNKSIPSRPPSSVGFSSKPENEMSNFSNSNMQNENSRPGSGIDRQKSPYDQFSVNSSNPSPMPTVRPTSVDMKKTPSPEPNYMKSSPSPIDISKSPSPHQLPLKSPITPVSPISLNAIINPGSVSPVTNKIDSFGSKFENDRPVSARKPPSANERPKLVTNGVKDPSRPPSSIKLFKGDNDSGVDESTQGHERNGQQSPGSPLKSPSKIPGPRPPSATPSNKSRSTSKNRLLKSPETPTDPNKKKIPMNKVQVGSAPSPNLKVVKSKIGSLENATHRPGGGHVKIETKKIDIKAAPRIEAKNDRYVPGGGDKKITSTKLQWNARSKIGSLDNANHKPGGGDKKIETIKTEFKDRAKPKVGSKDNMSYAPGGGDIKIQSHKLDIKAQSKIGSLDNVKHRPGGGDKKIFDDKEYLKSVDHPITPTPPSQTYTDRDR